VTELDELRGACTGQSPFAAADNPPPPAKDDAAASYAAMARAIDAVPRRELGTLILPCQKPVFEVTLRDDDGLPLAGARYTLVVDGGAQRAGTLDPQGTLSLADIDLDPAEWSLEVELEEVEDDSVYHLVLVRAAEPDAEPSPDDADEEVLGVVDLPLAWLRS
jgi:hypothetical protein